MEKNSERVEFETACNAYYRKTRLLKFLIVFFFPLYSILLLLSAAVCINNISQYSKEQFVFLFLFQTGLAAFLFITRKKTFKLTKEAWYYLLISFGGICVNGVITEGAESIPLAIVLFVLFFFYIYKRISLFELDKHE